MKILFYGLIFSLFINLAVYSTQKDSVRSYRLDEVTVQSGFILEPKNVTEIKSTSIKNSDAASINEFAKLIPSVKVQNNSRGESQIYLRGSNARQISLFFDGAPLNIPWDNRIDLSLVPADAVEYIGITKGVPSIVYGANTIAGVVNINTKELLSGKKSAGIKTQFGENSYKRFSGFWHNSYERFSYLITASYKKNNGFRLPESFDKTNENPSKYRTNSYSENINTFAKFNYKFSQASKIGLSLSYIDSEKGVPAELEVDGPRYWQYPVWKRFSTIINGEYNSSSEIFTYSFSFSKLKSQIDQFTDVSYSKLDDVEKGDDQTYYGRLNYQKVLNTSSIIRASVSGQTSTHTENILSDSYQSVDYTQNIFSVGAEYEFVKSNFSAIAGASFDGASTPKTGDKPAKEGTTDYSINTAFAYSITPNWIAKLNFGRKTRFPTLRESFSGALGKFVLNPDLKAEAAFTSEANISFRTKKLLTDLSLFANFLDDGIVRQSLPGKQFIRINKDKIRTLGLEFNSEFYLRKVLDAGFNFSYLNAFAKNAEGEFKDTLEYHPQFIAGMHINYKVMERVSALMEANFVGKEYGLKEGSEYFQKLNDYLLLNLRAAYTLPYNEQFDIEFFVRVNNIFDKLYYTQWGLPEAGREIFGGISIEFKN